MTGRAQPPVSAGSSLPQTTGSESPLVINHIRMTRLDDDLLLDLVEFPGLTQEDPDVLRLRRAEPGEDVEGLG
ncbi:hypothetical protein Pth03_06950 [Planotetraspora thailandica]|uniref:Uncharacterized protein n=1 Tax=Planotetraspora thailandica TaxID=487172 RepID=A0A8J3UZH3_9ACTN|nr:hypothetical protein Pth03_06950 [Planotetraspora thailandica]